VKKTDKSSGLPNDGEEKTKKVNAYFDAESTFWKEIYRKEDLYSVIHQERRGVAIKFFEDLALPKNTRILEIGCGAGFTTVDIARHGYTVEAVDSAESMVVLTRQNALESGLEKRITAKVDDIHNLDFPDRSFGVVIALGVAPWIADLNTAVKEILRVLEPGGHLIMNVDNRYRLNHLLDPADMPALAGLKEGMRSFLVQAGLKKEPGIPRTRRHTATEFNSLLASAGLEVIKHSMIGFGPFTFLRIPLFPTPVEIRLHRFLQRAANNGVPLIRSTASQYLVLARKE